MKDVWAAAEQDKDLTTVGGRLRWARLMKAMTQDDVAARMPDRGNGRKSRTMIAAYETKSAPSFEVVQDLAVILEEDPCFLAFGHRPSEPQGQSIPVNPGNTDGKEETVGPSAAVLPYSLLTELGAGKKNLALVRLDAESPAFGLRAGDYLLLDTDRTTVEADGRLYAVKTSAGVVLVRFEPLFSPSASGLNQISSGQGTSYAVASTSLEVLGQLVASVQRRI
jgi:hypothetical protein